MTNNLCKKKQENHEKAISFFLKHCQGFDSSIENAFSHDFCSSKLPVNEVCVETKIWGPLLHGCAPVRQELAGSIHNDTVRGPYLPPGAVRCVAVGGVFPWKKWRHKSHGFIDG